MNQAIREAEKDSPEGRPAIVLLDDRIDRVAIQEMNLSVYLDAEVILVRTLGELLQKIESNRPPQLIICRKDLKGENAPRLAVAVVRERRLTIPIISLGEAEDATAFDVVSLPDDGHARPLLKSAAQILQITPQKMAAIKTGKYFEFPNKYLSFLHSSPCPVFFSRGDEMTEAFLAGEELSRKKIRAAVQASEGSFYVESAARLKFVNAFTDQVHGAAENLASDESNPVKKMLAASTSMDIVAMQFQQAGVDRSILGLAASCVAAIEQIADRSPSLRALWADLSKAEGGYRFDHCQLITFIGFHMIKSMGWWGKYQRKVLSQAAFFHDIFLLTDEDARIHSANDLKKSGIKKTERINLILTHAQRAARELGSISEIDSEVVRVVLQHHGTKTGKGFARDLTGLENIAKVFIVAEEWADYVIACSETTNPIDPVHKMNEMKAMYPDPVAHQLIEALNHLNPENFDRDLVLAAIASAAPAPAPEPPARMNETISPETRIESVTEIIDNDRRTLVKGQREETTSSTRVRNVTQNFQDKLTLIKGVEGAQATSIQNPEPAALKLSGQHRQVKSLSGTTELMSAALRGYVDTVRNILQSEKGSAELRKQDSARRNCVHYAAMGGSVPMLKLLLENNGQKNSVDEKRRTPLFFAALGNHNDAFDFLVSQGCRVNQQAADGMTLAMIAARNGNLPMLKVVIGSGTRLDSRDRFHRTALDYARLFENHEIIEFLMAQNAEAKS